MGNDYRNNDTHEPARKGDVESALAAGAAIGNAQSPFAERAAEGTAAYTVVPKGYELKSLEEFLPRPLRIRQEVALQDTDSFIAYVNDFLPDAQRARKELFERLELVSLRHDRVRGGALGGAFRERRLRVADGGAGSQSGFDIPLVRRLVSVVIAIIVSHWLR